MKKIGKGLLCMAMFGLALGMCSCGDSSGKENTLKEEGTLRMATSAFFPPYEYYEGDQITGIDVELGQAIADRLGLKLKVSDMMFEEVLHSVSKGENDIGLAAITITDERKEEVDFSEPYAFGIQSVIIKEDSEIQSPEDLAQAKKIGVHKGTTGEAYCISDFGPDKVKTYNKINTALLDLESGLIDAIVVDHDVSIKCVEDNVGLRLLDTELVKEEYGIAVSKRNTALRDEINGILKEMKESGELDAILKEHLGGEIE